MAFDLKRALVNNWPMKVTALAAATVLWAAVAATEPTTQQVPIVLTVEPPPGRTLTREPPEVHAVFTGPAREIFKLYSTPPAIRKVIPNVAAASYTLELSTQDLAFAADGAASVQDVRPRVVEIYLDSVAERVVPVRSRVTVVPDSGFELVGAPLLDPPRVTIRGPKEPLQRVTEIATEEVTLADLRAPFREAVALDTARLGAVSPSRSTVDVVGQIAEITTRVLAAIPVVVVGPDGEAWRSATATVLLTVRGPSTRINRLTADSVSVTAQPPTGADSAFVRLRVDVPAGIGGRATPDSVMVRRSGP